MDNSLWLTVVMGMACALGSLAMLLVCWLWGEVKQLGRDINEYAIKHATSVDEVRVREILHHELQDIKSSLVRMEEKFDDVLRGS